MSTIPCTFCTKPCLYEEDEAPCKCCLACRNYQDEVDCNSFFDSYDDADTWNSSDDD